jgi:hypothetical protein
VAETAPPQERARDREVDSRRRGASSFAIDLSTVAGAGLIADGTGPVGRVGGAVALASRRGIHPSIALGALYALPFETGTSEVASRSRVLSFRALPAVQVLRTTRFTLGAGAGIGLDILSVEPSSNTLPAGWLGEGSTRVDTILTATVTGEIALASDVALVLVAMSDFDLASRHYVYNEGDRRSEVLAPWNVRPTLLAGLSFTVFGPPHFATGAQ